MSEFRIMISSPSPQWGESLALAFAINDLFEVIPFVTTEDMLDAVIRYRPDVLLFKVEDEDPKAIVAELQEKSPFTLPIILLDDPRKVDLFELLRMGLRGCLPIRLLPRQIVMAVEVIMKSGVLCIPRMTPDFFESPVPCKENMVANPLTGQELKVLALLGNNLSNHEISEALSLSESTIKTHLRSIFRKLNVRNRAEALMAGFGLGLIESKKFGQEPTLSGRSMTN